MHLQVDGTSPTLNNRTDEISPIYFSTAEKTFDKLSVSELSLEKSLIKV
jgi:hypothetical protein